MGIDVLVYTHARPDASGPLVVGADRFAYDATRRGSFGAFVCFNEWREAVVHAFVLPHFTPAEIETAIHARLTPDEAADIRWRLYMPLLDASLLSSSTATIVAMKLPARADVPLLELVTTAVTEGTFGPAVGRKLYTDLLRTAAWARTMPDPVWDVHADLLRTFAPFEAAECIAVLNAE